MTLNDSAFGKACDLYHGLPGKSTGVLRAAIETYLSEAFKPGQIVCAAAPVPLAPGELIVGEPIQPQRDYRKELWIAHWATVPATTQFNTAVESAQRAVQAFDKFFEEGGAQ